MLPELFYMNMDVQYYTFPTLLDRLPQSTANVLAKFLEISFVLLCVLRG